MSFQWNQERYPSHDPYPSPLPPPVAHKVWILDCKSCRTFFTNRGMKAVLLLRPNVSLYSTDAQPVNCSAWSPDSDGEDSVPSSRRTSPPSPTRTCDCLTQTLCCHGCGNSVGYMIVVPCARCTSSIATSNRSTNGHRFVFHSSEIVAVARRYVPRERAVNAFEAVVITQPVLASTPSQSLEHGSPYPPRNSSWYSHPSMVSPQSLPSLSPDSRDSRAPFRQPPQPYSSGNSAEYHPPISFSSIHSLPYQAVEYKENPIPRRLQAGEYVYWHHLARGGEILGVHDDERARRSPSPESSGLEANGFGISFDR